MQSGQNQLCPSCGVTLVMPLVRCPSCGYLLASAPGPVFRNSVRPRRARPGGGSSNGLATILTGLGLIAILVSAAAAFWLLRKRDDVAAVLPVAARSSSTPPASTDAPALEPNLLFAQAKSKALLWHEDAMLVQMDLAPVIDGKLDPSATLEIVFGKPVVGKRFGPGAPVQSGLFVVTASSAGLSSAERPGTNASAVAEPNCMFADVLERAVRSGLSVRDQLRLRYAQSQHSARGLWFVSRDGDAEPLRTLNGANCAIIVPSSAQAEK